MRQIFGETAILAKPQSGDTLHFFLPAKKFKKYNLPIHQDYPFNTMSRNAVTVWSPILDVTSAMGPMEIVPKSHNQLFPVTIKQNTSKKKFVSQLQMALSNPESLSADFDSNSICLPEMIAGDAFLFHSHLVNRSNKNDSVNANGFFIHVLVISAILNLLSVTGTPLDQNTHI